LRSFLPHATQFGFFHSASEIRSCSHSPAVTNDDPPRLQTGHPQQVPALLYTVYLWGVHLSQSPSLRSFATAFRERAQRHIATEISTHAQLLHTI
ncbi:hypothetical protein B0H13DRAFT_1620647, partial [Mycena leptocephala]